MVLRMDCLSKGEIMSSEDNHMNAEKKTRDSALTSDLKHFGDEADTDGPFKRLLSNAGVLAALLRMIIPGLEAYSVRELAIQIMKSMSQPLPEDLEYLQDFRVRGENLESFDPDAGLVIFDLLLRLTLPNGKKIIIDLEAQKTKSPGYKLYIGRTIIRPGSSRTRKDGSLSRRNIRSWSRSGRSGSWRTAPEIRRKASSVRRRISPSVGKTRILSRWQISWRFFSEILRLRRIYQRFCF